MKKICICCRGKSLKDIKDVPKVDTYLIVNEFTDELSIPDVRESLNGSSIFHLFNCWNYINIIPTMIKNNFYTDFNVKKIIAPYIKETSPTQQYNISGRNGNIPFEWYPEDLKPYLWYGENSKYKWDFPSCGNGAALYGAYYATEEIHIIGIDLYKAGVSGYASGVELIDIPHDGELMRQFLIEQTFSKFPQKQFYLYTCSDFDCELENVTIIKVEDEEAVWWEK